jgi:hypothetical protein
MTSALVKLVKPKTLTECVFDNSISGKLKHYYWRFVLNPARSLRQVGVKSADRKIGDVVGQLQAHGLVRQSADDFLTAEGKAALDASEAQIRLACASDEVTRVLEQGNNPELGKNYLVQIVPFDEPLEGDSPLLKLALDENILTAVANYMGLWPQIHAVGSWLNFPTGSEAKNSQLWHRDPEDLKTVKVFIYLDAVGPDNGPFTYIQKSHGFGAACGIEPNHAHPRRVLDHEMEKALPQSDWTVCTGGARSMIIADTVGFHRGGNVQKGRRLLITVTYTSGKPQEKRRLHLKNPPSWKLSDRQNFALMA